MAYKLMLKTPVDGMSFIWNVSSHVGCKATCQNKPTDVELVKFLLREVNQREPFVKLTQACKVPPVTLNSTFDAVLGFWIYANQDFPNTVVDGIVSPAKGEFYQPGGVWLITFWNARLHKLAPDVWANLDKNTQLSPALRAELAKTTP